MRFMLLLFVAVLSGTDRLAQFLRLFHPSHNELESHLESHR
jgi:hypothetical protein